MKRTAIVSALAMTVLAVGATSAIGHTTSIDTNISFQQGFNSTGGSARVTSGNPKCVSRRAVRFFAVEDQGTIAMGDDVRTLVDQDRTSDNGASYLEGVSPEGSDYFVVRVTKKDIGGANHDHVCEADSAAFS